MYNQNNQRMWGKQEKVSEFHIPRDGYLMSFEDQKEKKNQLNVHAVM